MIFADLFICGLVVHLVGDFVLQNERIALKKSNLKNIEAWIHGGIHLFLLLFVFSPIVAIGVAAIHMLIDTRVLMNWWRKFYGQTREGEMGVHVAIWEDQVFHIVVLFIAALLQTRFL